MKERSCAALIAVASLAPACGSGDGGPAPLVEDPAAPDGCLPEPPAGGEVRAKVVACAEELPGGTLAAGRVGDVILENEAVKFVIRTGDQGLYFPGSPAGGVIDAARQGGEDLLIELLPLAELGVARPAELAITEAGDDGPATVTLRGPATQIPLVAEALSASPVEAQLEVQYVLAADAEELEIRTVLRPLEGGDATATLQLGDLFLFGGRASAFLPGVGTPGGITGADFVAAAGGDTSYGIVYPGPGGIQFFEVAHLTAVLGPQRTLGNDEPIRRWLVLGDGSVGSITGRGWSLRGEPTGTLRGTTAPEADVRVTGAEGRPITVGRAGPDGRFHLDLPEGSYEARAARPGHAAGPAASVSIAAGEEVTTDLEAGAGGALELSVTDSAGTPLPARAVLRGEDGRRIHYTGAGGSLALPLPAGTYTLDVSRGPEYDAFTADPLVISDGATETIDATLERVVDTGGWISIDTHLHSEMSLDSAIPLEDRLRAVAAEGVEIALSTDHDFVTDYRPVLERLGLEDWLAAASGVETTTLTWGHVNAWPLEPNADRAGGGAFAWYGLGPGEVFSLMRERGEHVVIQLNHPRHPDSGFFQLVGFNRETGMATRDPAVIGLPGADLNDFNFDAIEVANDLDQEEFEASFADWLALASLGHPAAATGSSDSHGKSAYAGNSRTYVWVGPGNDDPRTVDLATVDQAIKRRQVVVSQGAFLTAAIVDPESGEPAAPGATVDLSGESEADLRIEIQAPPWMPLAGFRIFDGRSEVANQSLDPDETAALRFAGEVTVPLAGADSFFVVLVEPAGPGTPVLGEPSGSFTNPLRYDRDGDGAWDAPTSANL